MTCPHCKDRGYTMRPLSCNFPKPAVAMFKVMCICGAAEPIVLRTASEIETERRAAKGYPPIKRDGSHGE